MIYKVFWMFFLFVVEAESEKQNNTVRKANISDSIFAPWTSTLSSLCLEEGN